MLDHNGRSNAYVIELHPGSEDNIPNLMRAMAESEFRLLLDLDAGPRLRNGSAGRGVLLFVTWIDARLTVLRYGTPLTVWTLGQWEYQGKSSPMDQVIVERVQPHEHLVMQFDRSLWCEPLYRRPRLNLYPIYATVASFTITVALFFVCAFPLVALMIRIRNALGLPRVPGAIGTIYYHITFPLFIIFVWHPIRLLLSVSVYLQ
ncbi:hypothetical protein BDW62DRAFT_127959 [Aspergillus aurantiobrunneus]